MTENTTRKINYEDLIKAGVHFGHQTARWCPKMAPYIWGYKNNVHLIDISKTANQLEKASKFIASVVADGKSVLWIGTKKAAQEIIKNTANQLEMPYVNHRWIGGTLSNHPQVRKSVTKLLHFEDIISKSEKHPLYTKKEFTVFQKMVDRLQKNVGGIINLHWPLGAIVIVDVSKERSALKEAVAVGIPVVAIVDTNGDPSLVDYVIPANDDAPRSIKIILDHLAHAAQSGKAVAAAQGKEKPVAPARPTAPAMDESVALVLNSAEEEDEEGVAKRKAATAEESKRKAVKKTTSVEDEEGVATK